MDDDQLKALIMGFVAIVVGVVLIEAIADDVAATRDSYTATNNTVTLSSSRTATLGGTENVVLTAVNNGTFDWTSAIGTGVNVTADTGEIVFNNSFVASTPANVSYTYTNENYIDDSTTRNILPIIQIFFAVAIFAVGVFIVGKTLKDITGL